MPVSPALAHEIFFIEVWHFAALLLNVGGNALLYRYADKTPLLHSYLWLQGALLLWIVSKMLKTVAPHIDLRWFFIVTQYLGVCFLGPLFLAFAVRFRFDRIIPRPLFIGLCLVSSVFFVLFATNPLHHLLYSRYNFRGDSFGPLFPWLTSFTYGLIVLSILFCISGIRKKRSIAVGVLIALAAVIPLVINIFYTSRIFRPLFDITPIVMTTSVFFFGIAAFRFNFFGPLPIAQSVLLDTLADTLILTDRSGAVVYARGLPPGADPGSLPLGDDLSLNGRIFRLNARRLRGRAGFRLYTDVTSLVRLREALARENALLADSIEEIQRRNDRKFFVLEQESLQASRRALHDILGHSLTLVIFLLRRAIQDEKQGLVIDVKETLKQCASHVSGAFEGLGRELAGSIDRRGVLSLALQELVEDCGSLDIELELLFSGQERVLPENLVRALHDACREGVTNAVRHGAARSVSVSLLWGRRHLVVNVCDDGRGCETVVPGNGLTLMSSALRQFNCAVAWQSEPGAGYQLSIRAPLEP